MRGEPDAAQKIVDMLQGGARHSANTRFNARKAIRRHRIIKHVSAYIPGYTGFWDDDDEGDMGNMRGFADYVSEELGEKQKLKQNLFKFEFIFLSLLKQVKCWCGVS